MNNLFLFLPKHRSEMAREIERTIVPNQIRCVRIAELYDKSHQQASINHWTWTTNDKR